MKKILFLILIISGSYSISAQDAPTKAEKIKALEIAFITQKLELTTDEAQKFWPVYNQYENEISQTIASNKGGDVLDNEEKILNIRKKYRPEFVKILGQPRMNTLFTAQREFRNALIRNLRNRPAGQQNMPLRKRI